MKSIKKIYVAILSLALVMVNPGCMDILDEEPVALLTPEFFKTPAGIEGGLNAAYSYMRYMYGPQGMACQSTYGTDDYTYGGGGSATQALNIYSNLDAGHGDLPGPWNRAYPGINTCNGVIDLGPEADMDDEVRTQLIAEAKYLRAHYYLILIQIFGGVTLDLGSGPLRFNETPKNEFTRVSFRESIDAVIQDLTDAAAELPDAPGAPGKVWKASAYHLLAKAYLTAAWDESGTQADVDGALAAVAALIPDATSPIGNFGAVLQDDFESIFEHGNEYNLEVLYSVNRNADENFNERETDQGNGNNFYWRSIYYNPSQFTGIADPEDGINRSVEYGRPWWRFMPSAWLITEAFDNKDIDTRFDGTFRTVWNANVEDESTYATWTAADVTDGKLNQDGTPAVEGEPIYSIGDTAVWMIQAWNADLSAAELANIATKGYAAVTYDDVFNGPAGSGANGTISQRQNWPDMKKWDAPLRPVAGTEDDPNIRSTRPHIACRLAEAYLLGAEAAFLDGNNNLAAQYINTLRTRAAVAGQEAAMQINAGDIDIDFILDERSREMTGEMTRWYDLTRTDKLKERAEAYNQDVVVGSIDPDVHYVRPIPQGTIDLTFDPSTSDNKYPQNPGY